MALNIDPNMTATSFARNASLDVAPYVSSQTIVANAKNRNRTYDTHNLPHLPIDANDPDVVTYFSKLNSQFGTKDYAVLNHTYDIDYVAIKNVDSKKFHVIFKALSATLEDTVFAQDPKTFLFAGNGPFFKEEGSLPWDLVGKTYINNNPITYFPQTGPNSTRYVEWDNPALPNIPGYPLKHLRIGDVGNASGGDGFSSIAPMIGLYTSPGVWNPSKIQMGDTDSETFLKASSSSQYYGKFVSRHIVAYHPNQDILFIILKHYYDFYANIGPLADSLVGLGVPFAVFFDGASSVALWQYGKGVANPVLYDTFFWAGKNDKNSNLHVGYGISI